MRTKQKLLSLLLAAAMVLTLLPVAALAATVENCTDENCSHAAAIGTTHYDTLAEAITAAQDGDTVALLKDANESETLDVTKSITIEGNDYKINSTASRILWVSASDITVTLNNIEFVSQTAERGVQVNPNLTGVTLNINHCVVPGTYYAVNICSNTSLTLNIDGCTISGWGALNLWGNNYEVNVSNSTLKGTNDKSYNADGWNGFGTIVLEGDTTNQTEEHVEVCHVVLENCTIMATTVENADGNANIQKVILFNSKSKDNVVEIKGNSTIISNEQGDLTPFCIDNGTGNKLSITGGTFSSDPSEYVAEGYITAENSNGTYTVEELGEDNSVAKIGSTYYATLAGAVKAAKTGDTVTLLADTTDNSTITISSKTVTIDLNGHEIGFSANQYFYINANGKLVLTGSGRAYEQTPNYGPVMLRGNLMANQMSALEVGPEVTLEGWAGVFVNRNSNNNNGISVVVEGTLKSVRDTSNAIGAGIYINGSIQNTNDKTAPQIMLTETSRIESVGDGIYAAGYAVWNLAGDIDAGQDALSIKSGTFNITGGTYTAHGAFADPAAANNNGSESTGAALSITSNDGYAKKTVVNVTGGTFSSDNGYGVYEGIAQKNGAPAAAASYATITIEDGAFAGASDKVAVMLDALEDKKVISGGYFTSDPSDYVAAGLAAVPSDKDGYTYMVGVAVTSVSLDKTTLDLAVGETAKLTATVTPDGAAHKAVTWASNNESVATVKDGTVTAKAPGTATITVTTKDGGKTATCTVTVREEFAVSYKSEFGVAPDQQTVKSGTVITLPGALTADGYTFTGWKCGETVYEAGAEIEVTAAMTFVAQWNEIIAENVEVASGDTTASVAPELENNQNAKEVAAALAAPDTVKEEGLTGEAASVAKDTAAIANAVAEGQDHFGADADITIVVETYLDIQVTGVVNQAEGAQKSVTLNITPMYQLKATTNSSNMTEYNTIAIGRPQELKVTETVTITLPLPSVFNGNDHLYVKHVSKQGTFYYEPDADALQNGQVKFKNPHGFSEFTLISDARTATVAFLDKDGTVDNTLTLTPADVNQKLPSVTAPSGKYFDGWKFDGIKGTHTVLTDDLLTELAAKGDTVTATPVFSRDDFDTAPTYTVTAPSKVDNGTVKVSPSRAEKGDTVTITVTPDRGYELDEIIVTDKNGDELKLTEKSENRFTFRMPASKVSIEVSFVKTEEEPVKPVEPVELPFTDVAEDAWYAEAVQYVYEKGLMGGSDSAETFQPEAPTTRAMLVTILYRLEGEPAVTGASAYTDVPAGQYYTDAVAWATRSLIVEGYNGLFRPNDTLTRQDLAAILYRYASYKGYDMSQRADLTVYTDATQVSPYAADAMAWANAEELITGLPGTLLAPKSDSTRAVIATILMRFCENVAN